MLAPDFRKEDLILSVKFSKDTDFPDQKFKPCKILVTFKGQCVDL